MKFEFSIDIPAPREVVWKIAQDPDLRPTWDVRIAKYTIHSEPDAGTNITIVFRALFLRPVAQAKFLRFDPPRQSMVKIGAAVPDMVPSGGGTWLFEEMDTGTRMTTRFNLNTESTKAPDWLLRAVVSSDTKRSLQRLKKLVMSTIG
jgi:uncharacterized protein YndB with AHSA1/START domain